MTKPVPQRRRDPRMANLVYQGGRDTRAERAEKDCVDLFIALTEAVRRLKRLGGDYLDLLVVLERTGSKP